MQRLPFRLWSLSLVLTWLFLWTFISGFSVYAVAPGQLATPAPPAIHVVVSGDTLYSIALRYGVSMDAIAAANQLDDPNLIQIGQELTIPVPSGTVPPPPASTRQTMSLPPALPVQRIYTICHDNVRIHPLVLPADPIQLAAVGDELYIVADGALYHLSRSGLPATGALIPTALLPAERRIGGYWIRELVYATVEAESGDLLLLDKTNDVYRYTAAGEWRMAIPAAPVAGQFPDPQFIAIQASVGKIYALDSDLSRIWQLDEGVPRLFLTHSPLLNGVDMRLVNLQDGSALLTVLTREGTLLRYRNGRYTGIGSPFDGGAPPTWPAQIFAADGLLAIVESEQRSILAVDPASGEPVWQVHFRIPQMRRLRSAVVVSNTLYAIAGADLYVAELRSSGKNCPSVAFDDSFYFGTKKLDIILPKVTLPFSGAILPLRPRSYPGARRLYRYGVHNGLDLYGLDVAAGLEIGSPVRAIADGSVIRADSNYIEMTPGQYEAATARTVYEHRTPPAMEDLFLGRQVHVEHGNGVESRYAHLGSVEWSIVITPVISQSMVIGTVGVSGTSSGAYATSDGAHLHFEIWVNGRYLGEGLSLEETMRLWRWVFSLERKVVTSERDSVSSSNAISINALEPEDVQYD